MSTAILVLWSVTLAIAILLVAPTAFYLLNRLNSAARDVDTYTAETLAAARGISDALAGAAALEETPALINRARQAARGLAAESADLARGMPGRS